MKDTEGATTHDVRDFLVGYLEGSSGSDVFLDVDSDIDNAASFAIVRPSTHDVFRVTVESAKIEVQP